MHLKITQHLISEGTFGKVFEGKLVEESRESERDVAVKIGHVTNKVKHPLLLHEACALSILQGHRNIPEVYAWGRSQFYEYMALQKLGPTLREVFESDNPHPLSEKNMVILACQMLDVVKHVHSHGIIHRDIKPANFILGPTGTHLSGRLYLVDFGLSKRYRDLESNQHIPETRTPRATGCRTFSSAWDQVHITTSRRDDMISLAYTIIALLAPPLPWDMPLKDECSDDDEDDRSSDGERSSEDELSSAEDDSASEDHSSSEDDESSEADSSYSSDSGYEYTGDLVTKISRKKRWTLMKVVQSKLRWTKGRDIARGYPAVFHKFFDYVLSLGYEEDPDYDTWIKRFRDEIPDLPEDPLYDPTDLGSGGNLVGASRRHAKEPRLRQKDRIHALEASQPRTPVPHGDDGWKPTEDMHWRGPHTLESSEMLKDDELEFILGSGIHVIEQTPTSEIPLLDAGCPLERMAQVAKVKRLNYE